MRSDPWTESETCELKKSLAELKEGLISIVAILNKHGAGDLHRGNVSKRRNPLIADLFRRIDMVEAWGRGMTLIHQNAPNVTFRQVAGLFIASFARPSFSLNDQEAVEKTVDKTVDNGNKPTLTAREEALLRLLASSPHMTQKQLADHMGLTERGVRYLTDKLQKMGLLQRQGGKKAGQWVVAQAPKSEATK